MKLFKPIKVTVYFIWSSVVWWELDTELNAGPRSSHDRCSVMCWAKYIRSPAIKLSWSSTQLPNIAATEVAHCVFKSLHFTEVDIHEKICSRRHQSSDFTNSDSPVCGCWEDRSATFALHLWTHSKHITREPYTETWGLSESANGSGWMGKLLHRLPTIHISRSQAINNKRTPSCAQRHRGI